MTATLKVPLLNHRLTSIDAAEAQQLFDSGVPMAPESYSDDPRNYERIRRSQNLQWVVRSARIAAVQQLCGLSTETMADLYIRELAELQRLGLQVISFALTPSEENCTILTVTPWIEGMKRCSRQKFEETVLPITSVYIDGWANRSGPKPEVHEVNSPRQYSMAPATGEIVFLHDVEPPRAWVL